MADLREQAFQHFEQWYAEARQGVLNANARDAMTLATADAQGRPSARIVLFKGWVRGGISFYTNYQSHKARELEANPRAALVFYWNALGRQIRVEGRVERLTREESVAYFASRPRESQLGAWASDQSRPVESREALEERFSGLSQQYGKREIPCPPHWGGYRLVPELFEFWSERTGRLHEREQYRLASGQWVREILGP